MNTAEISRIIVSQRTENMTHTDSSDETELDGVIERNTREYIPVIVYVALIIIVGITVNVFATVFYCCKAQKSVTQVFMFCLSFNDLITNFILIDNLAGLFYFLQDKSVTACKLFYALRHWLVGDSLIFMVAIGVDRYRRVCFPVSKQITRRVAWCIIFLLTLFSFLLSVRIFATADVVRINITTGNNITVMGYLCSVSEDQTVAAIENVFHVIDIATHGAIICLLVFFYSFIVRNLVIFRKKMKSQKHYYKREQSREVRIDIHGTDHDEKDSGKKSKDILKTRDSIKAYNKNNLTPESNCKTDSNDSGVSNSKHMDDRKSTQLNKSADVGHERNDRVDRHNKEQKGEVKQLSSFSNCENSVEFRTLSKLEKKITIMTALISLASVACFVPFYISMVVFRSNINEHKLPGVMVITAQCSYMLNSVINPFIMMAFSVEFRQYFVKIFRRICPKPAT